MRAVVATRAGGPEVLEVRTLPDPSPGPGQLLVRVAAAGVNFIDTYRRSGLYPMTYPHVVGSEGTGTVVAVGRDVGAAGAGRSDAGGPAAGGPETGGPHVGDRVAWAESAGSYADLHLVSTRYAVPVPDGVDDATAAAVMLQGMTAHYLTTSTVALAPGDDVLVHAAAGGVGLLLTQLAVIHGARVIGTVGSPTKEALARGAGAAEVIRYHELDDLTAELPTLVSRLTGGRGVRVAYDGVGRDTFDASLASLSPRGYLVLFGASSGPVPPVDPQRLSRAGSVYLTRPTLASYVATREELTWRAGELFGLIAAGRLEVRIGATYPLDAAADAHRALEGRATTGKVLLLP